MKTLSLSFLLFLFGFILEAQKSFEPRIEPPHWYINMQNEHLQLMIHKPAISDFTRISVNTDQIQVTGMRSVESPNYLFIDLVIEKDLRSGPYEFTLKDASGENKFSFEYEFREREKGSAQRGSYSASDVIYLLMPDRFSNGDPANDSSPQTIEKSNRKEIGGRHGGDIQGIIDHLDYLSDLGITALWSTPLLLDNEKTYSYHTYAIADYYKIDPRFGTNEDYRRLADECHKRDIKLIMDIVTNHCGAAHWWMEDLPQRDWVHQFPQFTRSNHRKQTLNDPYAVKSDIDLYEDGWFDVTMPDLNQKNELLLNYLTQNTIWWIEYAGLDGLRVDTYPYNDKWAIAQWAKAILTEYPGLNIVGECWQHKSSELAYWQSGVQNHDGYDSYLPSGMDFVLTDQLEKAFNEDNQKWDDGVARFYNTLSNDYLFADPYNLLIFCDNHDITRYAGLVKDDIDKYKLAFSFLFTTRGIPQIYYGSEIMMKGNKEIGDGDIRRDFPGGWKDDKRNAFLPEGRTRVENEVFDHFRKLLNYRKNNPVLQTGKLIHYIPEDNIYVYFRMNGEKTIMVILNNNAVEKTISLDRYNKQLKGLGRGFEILTESIITDLTKISLPSKSAAIIEFAD